jgi:hypothetical protein
MRRLSRSDVPVEEQDFNAWLVPVPRSEGSEVAPVTILFSARDGIVSEQAAKIDRAATSGSGPSDLAGIRYERIDSSHLGFALNVEAYRALARALCNAPAERRD